MNGRRCDPTYCSRHGNGSLHAVEPDRQALSLTGWVVGEENPREWRYTVMLLCLCCHKIEHAGV